MSLKEILKTIYAPHKAFREIIQNPRYIGPMLILILFCFTGAVSTYAYLTKTYYEQTMPKNRFEDPSQARVDEWTEDPALWHTSEGCVVKANNMDYISGMNYGTNSIEFSAVNSAEMSAQLINIGPINCSNSGGYSKLYFRIKLTQPDFPPNGLWLYLYSSPTSYFCRNLIGEAKLTLNAWNNLTIALADGDWIQVGDADWTRINGLRIELTWQNKSDLRILLDGLFFGGVFKQAVDEATGYVTNSFAYTFMQFSIRWILLTGIIYVMCKAFKANISWRITMVLIGFTLITMFLQALANLAAFPITPNIKYSFEIIGGVNGEVKAAYAKLMEEVWFVNQLLSYAQAVFTVWSVALCAIAIRSMTEFSWSKSFLIAVVAYFATITIEGFLI
ncbi:MAG: Yip1 family protein [Candidatus Bathyarchaeia archaeon]